MALACPDPPVRLILVRHGESLWNAERRLQGWCDPPLSDAGRDQVNRVADRLASEPIDIIVSSPLRRAMETAYAIARRQPRPVEVIETAALKEINCGDWEGLSVNELTTVHADAWRLWQEAPHLSRMPNGEGILNVQDRGRHYLESLAAANPGATICVVTHAVMIMSLVCCYLGWELCRVWNTPRQPNTAVTVVRLTSSGPVLETVGDATHLGGQAVARREA